MDLFPLFAPSMGVAILGAYGLFALALTYWFSKGYNDSKTSFLVARRELNTFQGSLSVAAAWLWAPGLFISAQQAYVNGLVGLFWFCLGNFLTLGAEMTVVSPPTPVIEMLIPPLAPPALSFSK